MMSAVFSNEGGLDVGLHAHRTARACLSELGQGQGDRSGLHDDGHAVLGCVARAVVIPGRAGVPRRNGQVHRSGLQGARLLSVRRRGGFLGARHRDGGRVLLQEDQRAARPVPAGPHDRRHRHRDRERQTRHLPHPPGDVVVRGRPGSGRVLAATRLRVLPVGVQRSEPVRRRLLRTGRRQPDHGRQAAHRGLQPLRHGRGRQPHGRAHVPRGGRAQHPAGDCVPLGRAGDRRLPAAASRTP